MFSLGWAGVNRNTLGECCSPDLPSSRSAPPLGPGQLVIEYSGVGPNSGFESSLFIPLPRWGYLSKQMCMNKKLLTFIMEKHEYKQAKEPIVWRCLSAAFHYLQKPSGFAAE